MVSEPQFRSSILLKEIVVKINRRTGQHANIFGETKYTGNAEKIDIKSKNTSKFIENITNKFNN